MILEMSAAELIEKLKSKECKASEVLDECLERIEKLNPQLNAFVTMNERAVEEAREAEKENKPLAGLPIGVKDNTDVKGMRTTYGSKLFENNIAVEDSIIVERLRKAGAVIVGKTNLPEFGLVGHTDNPLFGPTRNPWDLKRTVGGSSGGSAAAVVSGMVPVATGNDGGGSIRIPSSFCSLYGLKPSLGRIPCYPSSPAFIGLVCEGFLTRYVEDTAFLMDLVAGRDDRDMQSIPKDDGYMRAIEEPIDGVKIAFSPDLGYATVDPEVEQIVRDSALKLEEVGEIDELDLKVPNMEFDLIAKVIFETVTMLDGVFEGWEEKVYPAYQGFLPMMDSMSFKDYVGIQENAQRLWQSLRPIFQEYDFLITPTLAIPPFEIEGASGLSEPIAGKPSTPVGWMPFTYPFNFTLQPAASIPAGYTKGGLPVGMQIVGKHFSDASVLRISKTYQEMSPWQDRKPTL